MRKAVWLCQIQRGGGRGGAGKEDGRWGNHKLKVNRARFGREEKFLLEKQNVKVAEGSSSRVVASKSFKNVVPTGNCGGEGCVGRESDFCVGVSSK
jgi:hypothetical protein